MNFDVPDFPISERRNSLSQVHIERTHAFSDLFIVVHEINQQKISASKREREAHSTVCTMFDHVFVKFQHKLF